MHGRIKFIITPPAQKCRHAGMPAFILFSRRSGHADIGRRRFRDYLVAASLYRRAHTWPRRRAPRTGGVSMMIITRLGDKAPPPLACLGPTGTSLFSFTLLQRRYDAAAATNCCYAG